MKTKDILIGVFALALIGLLAFVWLSPSGLKQTPDLTLTTINGNTIKLQELQGHPVLVTFWATSCPGCVAEIPHLVDLYQALAPKGLKMVAVAMSYDPPNHVVAMRDAKGIPYPIALDINGAAAKAFGDINVTPTSFLIAPDGRIVKQQIGEMDMAKVRAQIEGMLKG